MKKTDIINYSQGISFLFMGDVYAESMDNNVFSPEFKSMVKEHKIVCCNFEAPIYSENQIEAKENGMKLSQPINNVSVLLENGVNLFALANNHMMNYGIEGLKRTVEAIPEKNRMGAGLGYDDVYSERIYSDSGIKVGVINCAECQYGTAEEYNGVGHAWVGSGRIASKIREMKETCDYLILVIHAGFENLNVPLPEWRELYRKFIDEGVDVVVGHHPHVVQGWEEYKDGLIVYSLGNFIWESEHVLSSQEPSYVISLSFTQHGIDYSIVPIKYENHQVSIYEDTQYIRYLDELCNVLYSDEYIDKVNDAVEEQYQKYKNGVYEIIGLRPNNKLVNRVINAIKIILCKDYIDEKRLFMYVSNESLRWTIRRAISNKME